MSTPRRDALKRLATAGAGFALAPRVIWGQDASITVAGRPGANRDRVGEPIDRSHHRAVPSLAERRRPWSNRGALVDAASGRAAGRWRAPFAPRSRR